VSQRTEDDLPITGSEISIAVRVGAAARRLFGRPEPVAILKRRKEVKKELQRYIPSGTLGEGEYVEVLIVNRRKPDRAGEPDERWFKWGASDSAKVEVRGLGDRCLEFYGDLQYAKIRKGKAYLVTSDQEPDAIAVCVVGKLPYERIEFIDWEPDPTADAPRFYVRYGLRRNPCGGGIDLYLAENDGYPRKLDVEWKGRGGGPIKRFGRFVSSTVINYKLRRMDRRYRKEQADRL
jgi:hypothetical protein